jgi:hypothetical protein
MPGPLKGGSSSAASFDKLSKSLEKTADKLKETGAKELVEARVQQSKADGNPSVVKVKAAAAEAYFATSKLVERVGDAAADGAKAERAGSFVPPGIAGWVDAEVPEGARYVSRSVARGLGNITQAMSRIIGDGKLTTVREVQGDPIGARFSERMFGKAAAALQQRADVMAAMWTAWSEALSQLATVGGSPTLAAGHAYSVAGNLAKAAALSISASATKMAEFGVRLGAAAVQAAEQDSGGAHELMSISARFSAATANVLANPDQGQAQLIVGNQLAQYRTELGALVERHPALQQALRALLA